MGITNPRPAMRKGERQRTEAALRRHAELTREHEGRGLPREEASRRAFEQVKKESKK